MPSTTRALARVLLWLAAVDHIGVSICIVRPMTVSVDAESIGALFGVPRDAAPPA